MRRGTQRGWLAGVILLLAAGTVGESRQAPNLSEIMRQKLDHMQQILEGVALARFEIIERNANDLRILSELSSWNLLRTPEYLRYSSDFRDTSTRLTEAAIDQNLDAATLAYVELTLKCVECHKHVRGVQLARLQFERPLSGLARHQLSGVKPWDKQREITRPEHLR
jgi:hypothetical protein